MHPRLLAVPLMLTLGVAACGGSQPAPAPGSEPAATTAPATTVDPATAATVAGKVTLEGTPPANAPIRMNADPACVAANKGQTPTQETFVVGEGGALGNVFVYVQSGLSGYVPRSDVRRRASIRRIAATSRTCSACRSASRSRFSTAIRRCTTSTRPRRRTRSSTPPSPSRA